MHDYPDFGPPKPSNMLPKPGLQQSSGSMGSKASLEVSAVHFGSPEVVSCLLKAEAECNKAGERELGETQRVYGR